MIHVYSNVWNNDIYIYIHIYEIGWFELTIYYNSNLKIIGSNLDYTRNLQYK